jgi:tRNA-specific 2-thiouridylase
MQETPRTVVVAMSGGVDSSVAAACCLDRGWKVLGVTLELQATPEMSEAAVADAARVCRHLGIPHHVLNLRDAFRDKVLQPAWEEYCGGRTPNPCVRCNPTIKFGRLLEFADQHGADRVVTGHHARVVRRADGSLTELCRGRDVGKDQSYFLCRLSLAQLSRIDFPVGEMTKVEVRAEARRRDLPTAERRESQDACFSVPGETCATTLARLFATSSIPGRLVDMAGRELGRHEGIHRFTIGQRHGLGIALGRPAFVTHIDGITGDICVSVDADDLLCSDLTAEGVNWLVPPPTDPHSCLAQIRYRHAPRMATVQVLDEGRAEVHFSDPERGVAPGQAVVFYAADRVLGGGWIGNR